MERLVESVPYITRLIVKPTFDETMASMQHLLQNDIEINFDSETFYLTKDTTDGVSFPMDSRYLPKKFFQFVLDSILQHHMSENIKNTQNRIHFRGFKYNVKFENKENVLRIALFRELTLVAYHPDRVLTFLFNRLTEVQNVLLDDTLGVDDDAKRTLQTEARRIEIIIGAIQN